MTDRMRTRIADWKIIRLDGDFGVHLNAKGPRIPPAWLVGISGLDRLAQVAWVQKSLLSQSQAPGALAHEAWAKQVCYMPAGLTNEAPA